MSLIPLLFDNSRLLDQHFGLGMDLEDLMTSMAVSPAMQRQYYRPWRSQVRSTARHDAGSKITVDAEKYRVCLDVQQFAPEEISVKTVGRQIVVEGKHEEKEDEHGYISRHFVRKYVLPEEYRPEDVASSLSSDGILSIVAPRVRPALQEGERIVPILPTGPAHTTVKPAAEQKSE